MGEDWNYGGGDADLGKPVYAIGNGDVTYAQDVGGDGSWKGVIIIKHSAYPGSSFTVPGGPSDTTIKSFYAHLDVSKINDWVSVGSTVTRGQQIGVIGPTPTGSTGPHLHFEIRTDETIGLGPGYSSNRTGWMDPSAFIDANRQVSTTFSLRFVYVATNFAVLPSRVTWGPYYKDTESGVVTFANVPCATYPLSISGPWVLDASFGDYSSCGTAQQPVPCKRGNCITPPLTAEAAAIEATEGAGFGIGDRVEVYNTGGIGLRAWGDICSNGYVVKQEGAKGLVLDGPRCCDGYDRWQIRWDGESVARWSAEGDQATGEYWLRNVSVPVVNAPTITPNGGSFTGSVQITIETTTPGATITFTTNGTDPTINSAVYTGPFLLNVSATIKAKAFKSGSSDSSISRAAFIISPTSNQILYVSTTSIDVGSGATSVAVFVHNDGTGSMIWSASESCDWVALLTPGGTSIGPNDDNRLSFSTDANVSATERTCTITISAPGAQNSPQQILLRQGGVCDGGGQFDFIPRDIVLKDAPNGNAVDAPREGQTVHVEITLELLGPSSTICYSDAHVDVVWLDGNFWSAVMRSGDCYPILPKTYTLVADNAWTAAAGIHTLKFFSVAFSSSESNVCNNTIEKSFSVSPLDVESPTVAITMPTTEPVYRTPIGLLDLAGTSGDNLGVASVTWANDRGGSGTATGTDNWSAMGILLNPGINRITVSAHDFSSNTGSATVVVDAICVGPKADFDCDGDVDPADFDVFQPCMSYPNESVSVGCVGSDLEGDGDADLRDFSIIQNAFTGDLTVPPPTPNWTDISTTTRPPNRRLHAMAYDAAQQQLVLFGGTSYNAPGAPFGDTWLLNGASWTQANTVSAPAPRIAHVMTYDSIRHAVVLFGGYNFSDPSNPWRDTWEWDGISWTQKSTSGPVGRWGAAMAFDITGARVILFGGYKSQGGNWVPLDDTWAWNGTAWTQLPATGPSARAAHALAYDAARAQIVLFGGFSSVNQPIDDTWVLSSNSWIPKSPPQPRPAARLTHALAYDAARQRVVLFGGSLDANGSVVTNDTWEWDGTVWTQQSPSRRPSERQMHALAYDSDLQRIILFGGIGLDDTWEYGN